MSFLLRSLLLLPALVVPAIAADPAPAKVAATDREVVLDNGIISLTLNKRGGQGIVITYRSGGRTVELARGKSILYFDAGGGKAYPIAQAEARILRNGPDVAEVVWEGKPTAAYPFAADFHCVMFRDQPGFYLFAVYRHAPGMATGGIGETRFVIKGVPGTQPFTHHVVDDSRKGPYPTAAVTAQVQDATTRLEDGTIYTKYDNSAYLADHHVHGMAGHGVGLWMVMPSVEYVGGGPFKQELTVHKENVLLAMLVGGHYGAGGLRFRADEPWTKVYGPVFVYANGADTVDAMWKDAKARAATEVAKWPYRWLQEPAYPLERGTLTGSIKLTDGGSTRDAWVLLSPPGEDWSQVSKGYHFWTRADNQSRFAITNVRPGKYTLTAIGGDQFEPFTRENVEVAADKNDLGELRWEPIKHGRKLWQIGVADRSSAEFKGGDNFRHYDNFARYASEFPEDVTFTIGKSQEKMDWNFAQWAIFNKKPFWTIRFDVEKPLDGTATLTLGFVSAHPPRGGRTNLEVKVNGRMVDTMRLPKTGTAGYRSGGSDSPYHVVYVKFDATMLKPGTNEISLGHAEAVPAAEWKRGVPGQVMYDAIRLEVDATKPKP